ncbi:two component transcriptional regulator, LuxR family [Georgenia satyanarayanai]|uniref:Two component transcriptional regulator, LuxR family n=1 Tax=Georgenia satyanarayanai TaxID=860221 RepID=A0A2Y9ABT0_9MICO|nr:response regulator transcription factor [Georgenia satyanarayanai]PYG00322.1 LuxR family two component transcriptional regulator [Georgenia satyanarayanai]SSA40708.1 two component transcriptional regulator, LuxR family [Georgenia satyanarayanai]
MSTAPESTPIRVALVDDQQLVRAGFALVINSQPDMEVVAEASDGAQALRMLDSYAADVVLMDVRMAGMDGLTATEQLTSRGADGPKVVILTTFDLDEYVMRAIKAGASGFLLKDVPPEDMLDAIRTVHAGDGVIAPSSTKRLIEHLAQILPDEQKAPPAVLDTLTDREREVLVLMARGRSNTEIGAELFVAEATVKTHVGRVLSKLGARDRVQAVVVAYETGLVTPGS